MLLDSKSKFDIKSPTRGIPVSSETFYNWGSNHMYRTSYNDMHVKVRLNPSLMVKSRAPWGTRTMSFLITKGSSQAKSLITSTGHP